MKIIPLLQKEFDRETIITRKFLDQLPEKPYDWKPHKKEHEF